MNVSDPQPAIVIPSAIGPIQNADSVARAGVFRVDGTQIPESVYRRNGKRHTSQGSEAPADPAVMEQAIYGGKWTRAYGHFLLDTLARMWYFMDHPTVPVVWTSNTEQVLGWQSSVLETLGIRNPIRLVTRPTHVSEIVVPEAGFEVNRSFDPRQAAALGQFVGGGPSSGERLWLSRTKMSRSRVENEEEIEASLPAGWRVIHPQDYPLKEQLVMYDRAAQIAGFKGSAFHTLALMKQVRARIDIFNRDNVRHATFEMIADAKGFRQTLHDNPIVHLSGKKNTGLYRVADVQGLINRLAS